MTLGGGDVSDQHAPRRASHAEKVGRPAAEFDRLQPGYVWEQRISDSRFPLPNSVPLEANRFSSSFDPFGASSSHESRFIELGSS